jgi:hypothetical protein
VSPDPTPATVVVVVVSALYKMHVKIVLGLVGILNLRGSVSVLIIVVVLVLTLVFVLIHGELAVEEVNVAKVSRSVERVELPRPE